MPHHHGPPGSSIDGRDYRCHMISERRRRTAVTLSRQGDRHGRMAAGFEPGGNAVPGRTVEPQAGDQHDVHISSLLTLAWLPCVISAGLPPTIAPVPDDRLPG